MHFYISQCTTGITGTAKEKQQPLACTLYYQILDRNVQWVRTSLVVTNFLVDRWHTILLKSLFNPKNETGNGTPRLGFLALFIWWLLGSLYNKQHLQVGSNTVLITSVTNSQTFSPDKAVLRWTPFIFFLCKADGVVKWRVTSRIPLPIVDARIFLRNLALKG